MTHCVAARASALFLFADFPDARAARRPDLYILVLAVNDPRRQRVEGSGEVRLNTRVLNMRHFTSTAPARGARVPNPAISNSCL